MTYLHKSLSLSSLCNSAVTQLAIRSPMPVAKTKGYQLSEREIVSNVLHKPRKFTFKFARRFNGKGEVLVTSSLFRMSKHKLGAYFHYTDKGNRNRSN